MDKITKAIGVSVLTVSAVMVFVPFSVAAGALAGWIAGWFFGDTILMVAGQFGLHGVAMWQLGAFMGFVGGYLKTKVTAEVTAPK